MIPKLIDVHPVRDFVVHLQFSDGTEGDVDLEEELYGKVFEPLKERNLFLQFSIHPEFHTLCWSNGADLAPEFLYERARVPA